MKKILLIATAILGWTTMAHAATGTCLSIGVPAGGTCTSPTSLKQTIYEVDVSTDPSCQGGFVTLFKNSSGLTVDFTQNPTFPSGTVPDGTYKCVAAHISELQTYVPLDSMTSGPNSCVPGTSYTWDLFQTGTLTQPPPNEGASFTSNGSGSQNPWTYMSSASQLTGNNYTPATASMLGSPWVVNGNLTKTWVFDFDYTLGPNNQTIGPAAGVTPYCGATSQPNVFFR
jgi:hypothetical protein